MKNTMMGKAFCIVTVVLLLVPLTVATNAYNKEFLQPTILDNNNPPNPPAITGLTSGQIWKIYTYTITVTDPDQDHLASLEVNFGDGTFIQDNCGCENPWESGETIQVSHKWTKSGDYTIQARVMDNRGAWSDWGYMEVVMPKTYANPLKEKAILWKPLLSTVLSFYLKKESQVFEMQKQGDIINITVLEAWEMLHSEEDGMQLVIDDRTFQEYFDERIATPHLYDKPILYPLQLIEKPFFTNLFNMLFKGKEVIIYCRSANRSYIGAHILINNGFDGTLYNMVGGIKAWKAEGLPTVKGLGLGNN